MLFFSASVYSITYAQTSVAPEIPKNYKPQPKELLPMPKELTDADIFPVLGKYELIDEEGNVSIVSVALDQENKGLVWVNGLPQGKFRADLRVSPAIYKIPEQKTLQNDIDGEVVASVNTDTEGDVATTDARYSGKTLKGGALLYDSVTNKMYVNLGAKYNEDNPIAVFPELNTEMVSDAQDQDADATVAVTAENKKEKKVTKKEVEEKSITYVLNKIAQDNVQEDDVVVPDGAENNGNDNDNEQ